MMILPKEIHIEFHNKNHRDNMGIEGIDNKHIEDNIHIVVVEEHIVVVAAVEHKTVEEHIVAVAAVEHKTVEAVAADIDNMHILDVNYADAVDAADAADAAEEDIEGNIQQRVLH
jgi:hypothetical protein